MENILYIKQFIFPAPKTENICQTLVFWLNRKAHAAECFNPFHKTRSAETHYGGYLLLQVLPRSPNEGL